MSQMNQNEVWERFNEGMKRAVSVCKELALVTGKPMWFQVGESLEVMRMRGHVMYNAKSLTRAETLAGVDKIVQHMANDQEKAKNNGG